MAGHSKWANIKHRKAGQDAKRGKVFTKIIRELTVAARDGGGNIEDNPALRTVVEKAKAAQMPKDTMERAIARGAGGQDGSDLASISYEGYGPGGVAIYVETMTDNRNRTVAEVRHAFSRAGGNLGTDGSVAYLFDKRGQIYFVPGTDEDKLMEVAVEAGAEDVLTLDDGSVEVMTLPEDFHAVRNALAQAGFEVESAEVAMVPQTVTELDVETGEKVLRLLEALEDLDDVQNVYTNAEFPESLMEA
ncbi:MAG: YebC/PmpR family DNA-binding transcriptional regulator [Pseudomonadales bacterium]|nr:YebC/PmpR family DNA-binding transcriptional regulator [Pseudomonadales bacterium]